MRTKKEEDDGERMISFKKIISAKFLRLPRSFKVEVLNQIFPLDFENWMRVESFNSLAKWEARTKRCEVNREELEKFIVPRIRNLPIEFNSLIKKFVAWCGACCKPFYPEHLEEHGVERIRIEDIFEDLEKIVQDLREKSVNGRVRRGEIMDKFSAYLRSLLDKVEKVLGVYSLSFRS